MEYRHTQQAILPIALWIAFVIVLGILVPSEDRKLWIASFVIAITVIMVLFSRLNVRVTNDTVVAAFGIGWPRHTEDLTGIVSVHEVRNRWIHGWGIRKISGGWMYNVSGYDAVELELASGKKFRIGTDEPGLLAAAITMVLPRPHSA